jgi:hypothetical protein
MACSKHRSRITEWRENQVEEQSPEVAACTPRHINNAGISGSSGKA